VTDPADGPPATSAGITHVVVNPSALGKPSGFSHAVVSHGGRAVWLAGQTALDAGGTLVGPGDVVAQYDRALRNLLTALDDAGGRPEHLVSMTTYVLDVDDYRAHSRELGRVWKSLMGDHYPAMAAVGVTRLWDRDALVEVQGVAVLPG
jgi:enamine deaminase RidA (YjgF/YER057c/UK114 family)